MPPPAASESRQPAIVTVGVWALTIIVLVVLDDLTFGPVFWAIARFVGLWPAVAAVFAVYVPAQLFLVERGTREHPGRVAQWFLARYAVQRRSSAIAEKEMRLHAKVVGATSSVLLALVIGGVLPPLLLWRRGWDRPAVMRIALATSIAYATEFAVLHAWIPASI